MNPLKAIGRIYTQLIGPGLDNGDFTDSQTRQDAADDARDWLDLEGERTVDDYRGKSSWLRR
jgi:hypothetical protein